MQYFLIFRLKKETKPGGEKMPIYKIAVGNPGEASHPDALKAALAEFISMLIFVFAGEGAGMAFSKFFLKTSYIF